MVGIGKLANAENVFLKFARKAAVSSAVNPFRSLRSAPAQKQESTSLVRMRTRVGPRLLTPAAPPKVEGGGTSSPFVSYSLEMAFMLVRSSWRSWREIALRAAGRFYLC